MANSYSYQQIAQAAQNNGAPPSVLPTIASIAMAESGGDPNNFTQSNVDRSRGLLQINGLAHPEYDNSAMFDPNNNMAAARAISKNWTDFTPWSTYTQPNNSYKQYLPQAMQALGSKNMANSTVYNPLQLGPGQNNYLTNRPIDQQSDLINHILNRIASAQLPPTQQAMQTGYNPDGSAVSHPLQIDPNSSLGQFAAAQRTYANNMVTPADQAMPSLLGNQAGQNASLGFLRGAVAPPSAADFQARPIIQPPGYSSDDTDVPTRPAPHANPLAQILGNIAGLAVPKAAGAVNAVPYQSALGVANTQYQDAMQQYPFQHQQDVEAYQEWLRNHNEDVNLQELNEKMRLAQAPIYQQAQENYANLLNPAVAGSAQVNAQIPATQALGGLQQGQNVALGNMNAANTVNSTVPELAQNALAQYGAEVGKSGAVMGPLASIERAAYYGQGIQGRDQHYNNMDQQGQQKIDLKALGMQIQQAAKSTIDPSKLASLQMQYAQLDATSAASGQGHLPPFDLTNLSSAASNLGPSTQNQNNSPAMRDLAAQVREARKNSDNAFNAYTKYFTTHNGVPGKPLDSTSMLLSQLASQAKAHADDLQAQLGQRQTAQATPTPGGLGQIAPPGDSATRPGAPIRIPGQGASSTASKYRLVSPPAAGVPPVYARQ